MIQDLCFGMRMLVKSPGFALTVILTLGLALGANTTIFSLVNALLLRSPVGVADPARVVQIRPMEKAGGVEGFAYPEFEDLKGQNQTLAEIAVQTEAKLDLSLGGDVERIDGTLASGGYFRMLGMRPSLGRLLAETDVTTPGGDSVAVISASLWRRRFGADPGIIGSTIRLNAHPFTVIGVAAEGFTGTRFGQRVDVWVPLTMYRESIPWLTGVGPNFMSDRKNLWLMTLGRLKSGVSSLQAQTELRTLYTQNLQRNKPGVPIPEIDVSSGPLWAGSEFKDAARMIGLLSAVVLSLLLIASANIANLLLARSGRRGSEFAIRSALGASRWRILRMLLVESSLLAVMGGLAGLLIGAWLNRGLLAMLPTEYSGFFNELDQPFDWRVFAIMTMVSLFTGVVCGLFSAWKVSKPDLTTSLKEGGAAGLGASHQRVRAALVVSQAAISFVLLVGACLLIRTLQHARAIDLGFNPTNLMLAHLDPGKNNYSKSQLQLFPQQLVERIEGLTGVEAVSCADNSPMSGFSLTASVFIPGAGQPGSDQPQVAVGMDSVAQGYFKTLGVRLYAGREFQWTDRVGAAPVVIINQSLARRLWPNENPIGKKIIVPTAAFGSLSEFEIIGVAGDSKTDNLFESAGPHLYLPLSQASQGELTLLFRTSFDLMTLAPSVRQAVASLDHDLPVYGVTTLAEQINERLMSQRLAALLVSGFGLTALLLAGLGIYGVLSYSVTQRTREIGVRMALGAQKRDVISLIVGHGLRSTLLGVLLGVAGALSLSRWLTSWLYGVSPSDPLTYGVVIFVLLGAAFLACWLPARRAANIDPMQALRE